MALRPLDLMDPEEAVGNIWHDYAVGIGAQMSYPDEAATLASLRPSLTMMFRALGGAPGAELSEVPAVVARHRRPHIRKLATERDKVYLPSFDGERLRLPPVIDVFPARALNRAAYFWQVALAALCDPAALETCGEAGLQRDLAVIRANLSAGARTFAACPGLRDDYAAMVAHTLASRPNVRLPAPELAVEHALCEGLAGGTPHQLDSIAPSPRYMPFAPVPIWLDFDRAGSGSASDDPQDDAANAPQAVATTTRKMGARQSRDEANRKDSFILHRFEVDPVMGEVDEP